ncbi:hypothetical protein KVP09_13905 [Alcaligenaceae bacterium CGII-47]|nr:hypothetical protein [Alcaligenaceae bacterium CGII-47]
MNSLISTLTLFLSLAVAFIPNEVYAQMTGTAMMGGGMMGSWMGGGMMWLMGIFWLLIVVVLILTIAVLFKVLFKK